MNTRMGNIERQEQGRRMLEQRNSIALDSEVDHLHKEMGERLTAGMLGILDFLSGMGRSHSANDINTLICNIQQGIVQEISSLHEEITKLSKQLDEVRAGIQRIDRFTMQKLLGLPDSESSEEQVTPTSTTYNSVNQNPPISPTIGLSIKGERAAKAVVIERVFATCKNMIDSGLDLTHITATAIAHEAGVKPAQFTYAFKNKENFLKQFEQWLDENNKAEGTEKVSA